MDADIKVCSCRFAVSFSSSFNSSVCLSFASRLNALSFVFMATFFGTFGLFRRTLPENIVFSLLLKNLWPTAIAICFKNGATPFTTLSDLIPSFVDLLSSSYPHYPCVLFFSQSLALKPPAYNACDTHISFLCRGVMSRLPRYLFAAHRQPLLSFYEFHVDLRSLQQYTDAAISLSPITISIPLVDRVSELESLAIYQQSSLFLPASFPAASSVSNFSSIGIGFDGTFYPKESSGEGRGVSGAALSELESATYLRLNGSAVAFLSFVFFLKHQLFHLFSFFCRPAFTIQVHWSYGCVPTCYCYRSLMTLHTEDISAQLLPSQIASLLTCFSNILIQVPLLFSCPLASVSTLFSFSF